MFFFILSWEKPDPDLWAWKNQRENNNMIKASLQRLGTGIKSKSKSQSSQWWREPNSECCRAHTALWCNRQRLTFWWGSVNKCKFYHMASCKTANCSQCVLRLTFTAHIYHQAKFDIHLKVHSLPFALLNWLALVLVMCIRFDFRLQFPTI